MGLRAQGTGSRTTYTVLSTQESECIVHSALCIGERGLGAELRRTKRRSARFTHPRGGEQRTVGGAPPYAPTGASFCRGGRSLCIMNYAL